MLQCKPMQCNRTQCITKEQNEIQHVTTISRPVLKHATLQICTYNEIPTTCSMRHECKQRQAHKRASIRTYMHPMRRRAYLKDSDFVGIWLSIDVSNMLGHIPFCEGTEEVNDDLWLQRRLEQTRRAGEDFGLLHSNTQARTGTIFSMIGLHPR